MLYPAGPDPEKCFRSGDCAVGEAGRRTLQATRIGDTAEPSPDGGRGGGAEESRQPARPLTPSSIGEPFAAAAHCEQRAPMVQPHG